MKDPMELLAVAVCHEQGYTFTIEVPIGCSIDGAYRTLTEKNEGNSSIDEILLIENSSSGPIVIGHCANMDEWNRRRRDAFCG